MDANQVVTAINQVGNSFGSESHLYLHIPGVNFPGTAVTNKREEKASFAKVTKLVQNVLNSDETSYLNKMDVLKSFKIITNHFENKKRGFFENLFYGLFNKYYAWSARSLIDNYEKKMPVMSPKDFPLCKESFKGTTIVEVCSPNSKRTDSLATFLKDSDLQTNVKTIRINLSEEELPKDKTSFPTYEIYENNKLVSGHCSLDNIKEGLKNYLENKGNKEESD